MNSSMAGRDRDRDRDRERGRDRRNGRPSDGCRRDPAWEGLEPRALAGGGARGRIPHPRQRHGSQGPGGDHGRGGRGVRQIPGRPPARRGILARHAGRVRELEGRQRLARPVHRNRAADLAGGQTQDLVDVPGRRRPVVPRREPQGFPVEPGLVSNWPMRPLRRDPSRTRISPIRPSPTCRPWRRQARVTPSERQRLLADEKAIDTALGPNVDTTLGGHRSPGIRWSCTSMAR